MSIDAMRFEFSQAGVDRKTAAELGRYIAGMGGSQESLEQVVALVDVLKQFSKNEATEMRGAFNEARALFSGKAI